MEIISTKYKKLLNSEFTAALRSFSKKTKSPKNALLLINLLADIEITSERYNSLKDTLTQKYGLEVGPSGPDGTRTKTLEANQIQDFYLKKLGVERSDGHYTLEGATPENKAEYKKISEEFEQGFKNFSADMKEIQEETFEIPMLRRVKVMRSDISNEVISSFEVFLLKDFLDTSDLEEG